MIKRNMEVVFQAILMRLKSKEHLQEAVKIMGFSDTDVFKRNILKSAKLKKERLENIDITVRLNQHQLYVNMLNRKN